MSIMSFYRRVFFSGFMLLFLAITSCTEELYCCQLENGCIDGPVDGQQQCRNLGGTPVAGATCQRGKCVSQ